MDAAIHSSRQDGWRDQDMKTKLVRNAVIGVLTAEQARANYGCEIRTFRFPDPDRDLGGKFRNAPGPPFGNWVFSHFEKAIAARQ